MFDLAKQGDYGTLTRRLREEPEAVARAVDEEGNTLLHWAAQADAHDFLSGLISVARGVFQEKFPAFIDKASDKAKQTAAMWAVIYGNLRSLGSLRAAGASMTAIDSLQASLPILALQHQKLHALLLLARWGDLGQKDKNGCGLPHWAAYKGDVDALRLLHLWAGQDMRGADSQGMTPLHRAAYVGSEAACHFLVIKCYVDPAARNHDNETASDICRRGGRMTLAGFLDKCVEKASLVGKQVEDGGRSVSDVAPRVDEVVQAQKNIQWVMPIVYVLLMSVLVITYLLELATTPAVYLVCFMLSFPLYGYLVFSDSGRKHKRRVGQTAIEELQSQLEKISSNSLSSSEDRNEISQICLTCMDWKGPRTKHCSTCDACVDNFDHHCTWLNNCVAKRNHRLFVIMLYLTSIGQLSHFYASYMSLEGEGWIYPILGAFSTRPVLFVCIILHFILTPFIGVLALFHTQIIATNMNTNESHNRYKYSHFWRRVPTEGRPVVSTDACCNKPGMSEFEFVNPFDEGLVKNCYNFWLGVQSNSAGISKVKYVELQPIGLHEH